MQFIYRAVLLSLMLTAVVGCRPTPTPGETYMVAPAPVGLFGTSHAHQRASSHDFNKQ